MSKELEEFKEAIERAKASKGDILWQYDIEVLEYYYQKQVPMKPLLKDMGFEHYNMYCPSCKEYVGFRNSVRQSLTWKYCSDCGQALDWSDEK